MQNKKKKSTVPKVKRAAGLTLKLTEIPEKVSSKTHLIAGKFVHVDDYELKRRLSRGTLGGEPVYWHDGSSVIQKINFSRDRKKSKQLTFLTSSCMGGLCDEVRFIYIIYLLDM